MTPLTIKGANANPGAPRDWNERDGTCGRLPVRVTTEKGNGECGIFPPGPETARIVQCESAWAPSVDELKTLNEGGHVVLRVMGWQVPVALYVEPAEAEDVSRPSPPHAE